MLFLATVTHSLRWLMAQLSADHIKACLLSFRRSFPSSFWYVCFVLCCASRYSPSTMPWSQWYVASEATVAVKSMWQRCDVLVCPKLCIWLTQPHAWRKSRFTCPRKQKTRCCLSSILFFFFLLFYKNNRWTCFAKPTEACHPTMLLHTIYCMVETHLLRQTGVVMLIKPRTNLQMTGENNKESDWVKGSDRHHSFMACRHQGDANHLPH